MVYRESGFEQFNRERRKFAGRRIGDERRAVPDRRTEARRLTFQPVPRDLRTGMDRRRGEDRRSGERRAMEDRRNAAWRALSGE